jgi:hypothetical protein
MPIADIVRDIKNNSQILLMITKFIKGKFAWQDGYGT